MTNEIFMNEMMSDEQLDQVAGGTYFETLIDSKTLYEYGFVKKYVVEDTSIKTWLDIGNTVTEAWSKIGITCKFNGSTANEYSIVNGDSVTKISRNEAIKYLEENFKKVRNV